VIKRRVIVPDCRGHTKKWSRKQLRGYRSGVEVCGRLDVALQLLQASNATIADIANRVGFSDAASLHGR